MPVNGKRWASQSLDPHYKTLDDRAKFGSETMAISVGWVKGGFATEAHQCQLTGKGGPRKASTHPTKLQNKTARF